MKKPEPRHPVRYLADRTIILGMNNPYSTDQKYALFPSPEKSAGYRLYAMLRDRAEEEGLTITRKDYIDAFDRRNLLPSSRWNYSQGRTAGMEFMDANYRRNIIALGRDVERCLGIRRAERGVWKMHYHLPHPTCVCVVPHPSGLCQDYNDPEVRRAVGDVLLRQYRRVDLEAIRGGAGET